MKNGHFLLLFLAAFLLAGCFKSLTPSYPVQDKSNSSLESIAIQAADDLWSNLHFGKNTKTNSSLGIESIAPVSLPSELSDTYPTDSIFIINYCNDAGFSLVAADRDEADVLALIESGSLDDQKLFQENVQYEFEGEQIVYNYIESLIYNYSIDNKRKSRRLPRTRLNPGEEYNVWYTDSIIHPLVHYKWDQTYPFNSYMPAVPDTLTAFGPTSFYRGKHAVGCVIVAAMQMVVATNHPSTMIIDSFTYQMNSFSGVSMYYNYTLFKPNNYDTSVGPRLKVKTQQLACLLRYFGDSIGAIHKPNGATSASCTNAMNFLSSLDSERYDSWSMDDCLLGYVGNKTALFNMMSAGKPAIIEGSRIVSPADTTKVGHAWLVDGYLRRHLTRPDDDVFTSHYVHFNWGYQGKYDGYYLNTKISDRLEQDITYDTNPASVSSNSKNYNINTHVYLY